MGAGQEKINVIRIFRYFNIIYYFFKFEWLLNKMNNYQKKKWNKIVRIIFSNINFMTF